MKLMFEKKIVLDPYNLIKGIIWLMAAILMIAPNIEYKLKGK